MDRNVVGFDAAELKNLRREAELNHVDFSRARITQVRTGGYTVVLDKPLFDLGNVLTDVPSEIDARSTAIAEGELLTWLMKIQRAERQKLRIGRVFGWSGDQISRCALSADEVSEYLAEVAHKKQVAELQKQLAAVLESNAVAATATAGADALKDRYGLSAPTPAKPAKVDPLPSAKPKRAPSRGARA